jgi:hypothetical protein
MVLVVVALGLACIPAAQAASLGGNDYNDGSGNAPGLTYTQGSVTIGEEGDDKAWSFAPINWIDTTDANGSSIFVRSLVRRERDEALWGGVSFFTDDQDDEIMYFGTAIGSGAELREFFGVHNQESGEQAASTLRFDAGTTHLMVGELDLDAGVVNLWVDPAFGDTPPTPLLTAPFAMEFPGKEVGSVRLNAGGDAFITGDEVVVGTTWSDVVPSAPGFDLGDVNMDGEVNGLDVDPFVDVLLNGPYQVEADMNKDNEVNGLDVDPFVAAVVGGGVQAVPEPATLALAGMGLLGLLWFGRKRR